MIGWIVAAVVVLLAIYAIVIFNRLIRLRNLAREGWSGIDVQLKRRSDLVPNLVEVVKAYAAHERTVFEDVASRRASTISAADIGRRASAERELQGALGRLFAVAESYPQLKADENFLALQQQLAEIEDQLQMARRYYNGTARNLNISIESFPSNLVARAIGFQEQPFFELDDRSQAATPNVAFEASKP